MESNNPYEQVHPACYTPEQISDVVEPVLGNVLAFGTVIYMVALLITVYLFVTLTNYTKLIKFEYSVEKTLYTTVVLIIFANFVGYFLNINPLYLTDVSVMTILAMFYIAYKQ